MVGSGVGANSGSGATSVSGASSGAGSGTFIFLKWSEDLGPSRANSGSRACSGSGACSGSRAESGILIFRNWLKVLTKILWIWNSDKLYKKLSAKVIPVCLSKLTVKPHFVCHTEKSINLFLLKPGKINVKKTFPTAIQRKKM
jgi:hypothetical protein